MPLPVVQPPHKSDALPLTCNKLISQKRSLERNFLILHFRFILAQRIIPQNFAHSCCPNNVQSCELGVRRQCKRSRECTRDLWFASDVRARFASSERVEAALLATGAKGRWGRLRERSKPAGSLSPGMMARGPPIDLGQRCAPERGALRSLRLARLVPPRLCSPSSRDRTGPNDTATIETDARTHRGRAPHATRRTVFRNSCLTARKLQLHHFLVLEFWFVGVRLFWFRFLWVLKDPL